MGPELRRRSAGRTQPGSERGSSVIGFLLVFPLVLFMSFGLLQLVFYALAVEEISTAAREGARRAADLDPGAAEAGDQCLLDEFRRRVLRFRRPAGRLPISI